MKHHDAIAESGRARARTLHDTSMALWRWGAAARGLSTDHESSAAREIHVYSGSFDIKWVRCQVTDLTQVMCGPGKWSAVCEATEVCGERSGLVKPEPAKLDAPRIPRTHDFDTRLPVPSPWLAVLPSKL